MVLERESGCGVKPDVVALGADLSADPLLKEWTARTLCPAMTTVDSPRDR